MNKFFMLLVLVLVLGTVYISCASDNSKGMNRGQASLAKESSSVTSKKFCGKWGSVTARHDGEDKKNGGHILVDSKIIASDLLDHGTEESIFSSTIDQLKDGDQVCIYGVLSTDQENIHFNVLDKITGVVLMK